MKRLFLIRHAKSSWDSSASSDFDRPLNDRGLSDAPKMADYLKTEGILPDFILCSAALRAQTTAKLLIQKMGLDVGILQEDRQLYLADVNQLQSILRGVSDSFETIFVIGHNPTITDCANALTGDNLENVPTSGIYGVEMAIDSWLKLRNGIGKKIFFQAPKLL